MKLSPAQQRFIDKVKSTNGKGYHFYCEERRTMNVLEKKGLVKGETVLNEYRAFLVDNEETPKTLSECKTDYKIVIDKNGKQYKVARGKEFLNLMMRLQKKGLA